MTDMSAGDDDRKQVSQILFDSIRRTLEDHGYVHGYAVVKRVSRNSWAITTGITSEPASPEMVEAVESAFVGGGGSFGGGGASGGW